MIFQPLLGDPDLMIFDMEGAFHQYRLRACRPIYVTSGASSLQLTGHYILITKVGSE